MSVESLDYVTMQVLKNKYLNKLSRNIWVSRFYHFIIKKGGKLAKKASSIMLVFFIDHMLHI